MARRKLEIEIVGDHRSVSRTFDAVERRSDSFGAKLARVSRGIALGLGAGLLGVGAAAASMGLDFVHAAEESRKVTRQTEAVLASMGNVAGVTAEQVADLSEQLSLQSGVDDELIQSGQNVLLTFGNVRNEVGRGNDVFSRATELALDMSVALGGDMQSSVIQLGKALNDPIRGLTALQRVGVSFTDQQKEQIRTLVEQGDLLGAQRIILDELTRQFGGSAEAQATATDRMRVAWGNLQEHIGEALLPAFESLSNWVIETGIPAFESFVTTVREEWIPALQETASNIAEEIRPEIQGWSDDVAAIRDRLGEFFDLFSEGTDRAGQDSERARGDNEKLRQQVIRGIGTVGEWTLKWIGWQITATTAVFRFGAFLADAMKAAGRFFVRVWDGAFQFFHRGIEGLKRALRSFKRSASSALEGAGNVSGGWLSGLSRLNPFPHGGIVPGSFSQVVPIVAHGSEMVLNPRQQANLFRALDTGATDAAGGGVRYVTHNHFHQTHLHVSGRDLIQALNDELKHGAILENREGRRL